MKPLATLTLGIATICVATTAAAQEKRFHLGLRTGYSIPLGDAYKAGTVNGLTFPVDVAMSDVIKYQVPIWIDAGYMITPNFMLGLYFQYGIVGIKDRGTNSTVGCASGASCSAHSIHYGVQGQYHFGPGETLNPWLGLGIGRETMYTSMTQNGASSNGDLSGWEFATLQSGLDFAVANGFGIGPFVGFSLGQYSTVQGESRGLSVEVDIPTALHEWLTLGVRGAFGF